MKESWEETVEKRKQEKLFQMDDFFQKNVAKFRESFLIHFDLLCKEIVKKQERGELFTISYLDYTLMYHRFLQREYVTEVRVYGKQWFCDHRQTAVGNFEVSMLFAALTELWDELLKERKLYVGKVSSKTVKEFIVQVLPSFFAYVGSGIRSGILLAVEKESFKQMERAEKFEINVGQYMGNMEPMYKENKNKDCEWFLDWFRQRLKYDYMFEDLSGMDFSQTDLSEIDFRYSDLRNTILKGCDLQDSMLFGTRFCYADMEEADLRYCLLFEADFTGANLKGARFRRSLGNAGLQGRKVWRVVGYQGVNFRNADLRGADFREAELFGADFTGAKMEGTILDKEMVAYLCLSETQRNEIIGR